MIKRPMAFAFLCMCPASLHDINLDNFSEHAAACRIGLVRGIPYYAYIELTLLTTNCSHLYTYYIFAKLPCCNQYKDPRSILHSSLGPAGKVGIVAEPATEAACVKDRPEPDLVTSAYLSCLCDRRYGSCI